MQDVIVSIVVPALCYKIFHLRVLAGNKQQLEVSEEGTLLMRGTRGTYRALVIIVEIVLVVLTERQVEDADYEFVPRFLMCQTH